MSDTISQRIFGKSTKERLFEIVDELLKEQKAQWNRIVELEVENHDLKVVIETLKGRS
jgi:hypothetical protein